MVNQFQDKNIAALEVGSMLHQFQIDQVLGQGHFGIVYKAWDNDLEVYRAIKEYFPTEYAHRYDEKIQPTHHRYKDIFKQGRHFFEQEARTLAKIDHPNILKVISSFQENDTIYTVMEYIEGQSLTNFIADNPETISPALIQKWLSHLLDALSVLHERAIFHRDIKPDNILINTKKQPIIIDFGAAQYYLHNDHGDYSNIASPPYSPLELYDQTHTSANASIDIYALGQVFYELISKEKAIAALRRTQQFDPQPQLSTKKVLKHFDKNLLKSIDIATQTLTENRFENIIQWQATLDGKSIKKIPHSNLASDKKSLSKIVVITFIFVILSAAALWFYFSPPTSTNTAKPIENIQTCFNLLTEREINKGTECFEHYAQAKDPQAMYELGKIYKEQDPERAFSMTMAAAERHYTEAMYLLSWYYQDGIGTEINHDIALEWLTAAGEKKHIHAIQDLIQIYTVLHKNDPSESHEQQIQYWQHKLTETKNSAGNAI